MLLVKTGNWFKCVAVGKQPTFNEGEAKSTGYTGIGRLNQLVIIRQLTSNCNSIYNLFRYFIEILIQLVQYPLQICRDVHTNI